MQGGGVCVREREIRVSGRRVMSRIGRSSRIRTSKDSGEL